MREFDQKRQYAKHIVKLLPYLNEEQIRSYANVIAGAAMTNQMVAQMKNAEPPKLNSELTGLDSIGAGA